MQVIGEWDSRAVASAFTLLKQEADRVQTLAGRGE